MPSWEKSQVKSGTSMEHFGTLLVEQEQASPPVLLSGLLKFS
jgi:hypothetical protein